MSKFKDLVDSLDGAGLDELRLMVNAEARERRQAGAIRMEHIHPGMTDEQKDAAAKEIARVLRGED